MSRSGIYRGDLTMNQRGVRRMTVHEAARALGISEDAVRMRVKRKTLKAEREGGRLYVLLTSDLTTDPTDRTDELLAELRDRVRSLEDALDQERTAHGEARRLAAMLAARIPELEPPAQDSPGEASESPPERQEEPVPTDTSPGPEEGSEAESERAPWWRRIFG